MAMLTLPEFEDILSEFDWELAIRQFRATDWTSSSPGVPNRPSWVLGHSYSEHRSFIGPTLASTLAGSDLADYLPDRMHYTLQEVALTLVASAVNGTFSVPDFLSGTRPRGYARGVAHTFYG